MKRKLIGVAVVAAIALVGGWNYNQSQNETKLNDLALANVEALADNEGGALWWCCGYWGSCKTDGGTYLHGFFQVTPCN